MRSQINTYFIVSNSGGGGGGRSSNAALAAAALKKLFLRIPIPHADGLTDAARGHPITHISLVIP